LLLKSWPRNSENGNHDITESRSVPSHHPVQGPPFPGCWVMWAELGSRGSWPVPGDRSWGLHDLHQVVKTQENWRHQGDMERSPAQGRGSYDSHHLLLMTHRVELSIEHQVAEKATHTRNGTNNSVLL
jgi:hypothetical protein